MLRSALRKHTTCTALSLFIRHLSLCFVEYMMMVILCYCLHNQLRYAKRITATHTNLPKTNQMWFRTKTFPINKQYGMQDAYILDEHKITEIILRLNHTVGQHLDQSIVQQTTTRIQFVTVPFEQNRHLAWLILVVGQLWRRRNDSRLGVGWRGRISWWSRICGYKHLNGVKSVLLLLVSYLNRNQSPFWKYSLLPS